MKGNIKALFTIITGALLSLCLFACGGQEPVNPPPDTYTLTINQDSVTLAEGDSVTLTATYDGEGKIIWSSDNVSVAAVSGGVVTAIGEGSATITARVGEDKDTVSVTVTKKAKTEYTVTVDGESWTFAEGTVIARPATPTKPATAEKEYVFKGWYIVGTDTEYNFVANGNVEVEARFDEVTRKYTVTFDGKNSKKYEYGSLIAKPADPTKEPIGGDVEFDFVGWFNGETAWDFEADTVQGDVNLTAKFNEVARRYNLTVSIVPEAISLKGVPALPLFDFTEADYEGMNPVLTDGEGAEIAATASNGKISARLAPGNYTLKLTYRGKELTSQIKMFASNSTSRIYVEQDADVGGSIRGEVNGKAYEYPSYGAGYTYTDGVLKTTGHSYAYIGGEFTDTYYMEADVKLNSVGRMIGILGAAEFGNLSDDSGRGLQGEDDKLKNKLVFSFSGGNSLYHQDGNHWSGAGIVRLAARIDESVAVASNHKLAVLRKGNHYYVLINDVLFGHYETDFYGASGFGFCNANGGTATYSNINYTVLPSVVDAILEKYDTSAFLGGSFTYPDGKAYDSFNGGYTLTSNNSGTIKGPSYLYATNTVGNVYYLECTFSNTPNWIGLLVNTLDLEPQQNKGWLAYGHAYGQIYHHNKDGGWGSGTPHGAYAIGTGEWKMGVARVNNVYYVFINDKLCLEHTYDAFKTSNHGEPLPRDNASGMGIFCGSNYQNVSTFKDFYATTDFAEVTEKIGDYARAELTLADGVTVEQNGKAVKSGEGIIAGVKTEITANAPAGKKLGNLVVKKDGVEMGAEYEDGRFVLYPVSGSSYEISATFTEETNRKVKLNLIPVTNKVGDKSYALYDMTVDPDEVEISVFSYDSGTESVTVAPALSFETEYATGYYEITVTYKSNQYSYVVALEKDVELTCFLSPVYLGGTITIPNENGVETTYKSYNENAYNSTEGVGWSLVDGRRDTITVKSHTYAFQHQQTGTKYYVEGKFDASQNNNMFNGMGGLLISHGPKHLADSSDKKLFAGIYGDSVILVVAPGWDTADSRLIANYVEIIGEVDPSCVKLGVVRDETDYWFFVNDKYVGYYAYEEITTESGFGVACVPATVTITNFNYSFCDEYIEALKATAPKHQGREIDVYLIAGQSNAAGTTYVKEYEAKRYDERLVYGTNNIWYAGNSVSNGINPTAGRRIGWGLVRMNQGGNSAQFGPEAGMMLSLSDYYNFGSGKVAGFLKSAHGGTALLDDIGGESRVGGNWVSPSYEKVITPKSPGQLTGGLYRALMKDVTDYVNDLKELGFTKINVKGMFWMQGEQDKWSPDEYKRAFGYFASDVRADLGKIMGEDLTKMPIFVGEISRTSGSADANTVNQNNKFIAMQNTLPSVSNDIHIIASGQFDIAKVVNGAVVGSDSWHWNQNDMLTIGKMVGDCIKNNVLNK